MFQKNPVKWLGMSVLLLALLIMGVMSSASAQAAPSCAKDGIVTSGTGANGQSYRYQDSCLKYSGNKYLVRTGYCYAYAGGMTYGSKVVFCDAGCTNGVCETKVSPSCTKVGNVTSGIKADGSSYTMTDGCAKGSYDKYMAYGLRCNGSASVAFREDCSGACVDGKCVQSIVPTCAKQDGVTTGVRADGTQVTINDECKEFVPGQFLVYGGKCSPHAGGQTPLGYVLSFCEYGCANAKCLDKPVPTCTKANGVTTGVRVDGTSVKFTDTCIEFGPGQFLVYGGKCSPYSGGQTPMGYVMDFCDNGCSNGACDTEPKAQVQGVKIFNQSFKNIQKKLLK